MGGQECADSYASASPIHLLVCVCGGEGGWVGGGRISAHVGQCEIERRRDTYCSTSMNRQPIVGL